MELKVMQKGGRSLTIQMEINDTILSIKRKVEDLAHTPCSKQMQVGAKRRNGRVVDTTGKIDPNQSEGSFSWIRVTSCNGRR